MGELCEPKNNMFNLTEKENSEFNNQINYLLNDDNIKKMKSYIQHGNTNTYAHVINVAKLSFIINKKLNLHCDTDSMIKGAMLHDFYLYDWHEKDEERDKKYGLHGFSHPEVSLTNAKKYFDINENEENIIRNHMWPLTITHIPKSKEAWVVCIADKIVSLIETFKR